MKKILVLVNDAITILHFRGELIERLVDCGYEVLVSVPVNTRNNEIEQLGARIIETELSRKGKNPFQEIKLYNAYKRLLKKEKPDLVLSYTVKPNVYGGMACKKQNIPYIATVTGLGDAIENNGILQKLVLFLYGQGIRKASRVFFENTSNLQFFINKKVVEDRNVLIPGTGVNLQKFIYLDYPKDEVANILFVGRITRDKGVFELAETAKLYARNDKIRFTIVGTADLGEVNPFEGLPNVLCVGYQKNVVDYLRQAHAVILPSYHEGMSNSLMEAAACGRPILATAIPGCKEVFNEGITGFGFEPKKVESLQKTIEKFLALESAEREQMGIKARKKMEEEFNRDLVVDMYMEAITQILS